MTRCFTVFFFVSLVLETWDELPWISTALTLVPRAFLGLFVSVDDFFSYLLIRVFLKICAPTFLWKFLLSLALSMEGTARLGSTLLSRRGFSFLEQDNSFFFVCMFAFHFLASFLICDIIRAVIVPTTSWFMVFPPFACLTRCVRLGVPKLAEFPTLNPHNLDSLDSLEELLGPIDVPLNAWNWTCVFMACFCILPDLFAREVSTGLARLRNFFMRLDYNDGWADALACLEYPLIPVRSASSFVGEIIMSSVIFREGQGSWTYEELLREPMRIKERLGAVWVGNVQTFRETRARQRREEAEARESRSRGPGEIEEIARALGNDQSAEHSRSEGQDPQCVVCYTTEATVACLPCGHRVVCEGCLPQFTSNASDHPLCPICREPRTETRRIF
jgi:hypothetical protein